MWVARVACFRLIRPASAAGPTSAARRLLPRLFISRAHNRKPGESVLRDAYSLAESPTEVKFVANIPDSTSGTLNSFFPRVLVFVNPRFVRRINSPGPCTKDAHSPTAARRRLLLSNCARLRRRRSSAHLMPRIQLTIDRLVAQNRLHVIARLSKGNRFHKLIHAVILADRLPIRYPAVARIVGSKGVRSLAVKLVQCLLQVARAKPDIGLRIEQLDLVEMADALFLRHRTAHRGQQLHQPPSIGAD